jgi:hypothetical protein
MNYKPLRKGHKQEKKMKTKQMILSLTIMSMTCIAPIGLQAQMKGKALLEKYSSCQHVKPEDNKLGFSIVSISKEEGNEFFVQWESSLDVIMKNSRNQLFTAALLYFIDVNDFSNYKNGLSASFKGNIGEQDKMIIIFKKASILDKYRAGLSYLDGSGTFDEAKFREFNRITGNRFSNADMEKQLMYAKQMIRGMEDLKQVLRSSTVEAIHTFEELERNGLDLSKYDV